MLIKAKNKLRPTYYFFKLGVYITKTNGVNGEF